jgi:hypothetical protein
VTESRPTISPANDIPDEPHLPSNDPMREMRTEVNAYAGAILLKLLAIVNEMPGRRRDEIQRIDREIRQMLAFVDPQLAAELDRQPPILAPDDETAEPNRNNGELPATRVEERIEALIGRLEASDLRDETTVELLRDLRATVYTLREDLRTQHDTTTEALQSLISTTRSLHYTVTALSARSEQITDLSGIAEEQIRVGVWKYALIAGISSGAIVAAIIAFISLAI